MTTPDTRPAITEEQLQRLVHAIQRSGASVNLSDPRVSQLQTWIIGVVGVGLIAAGAWVGQSIWALSATVTSAITRLDQYGTMLSDHEQRLRQQEQKP